MEMCIGKFLNKQYAPKTVLSLQKNPKACKGNESAKQIILPIHT